MGKGSKKNVTEDREYQDKTITEFGRVYLQKKQGNIELLSIIGEIEGHDVLGSGCKCTKYEHILPELADIEYNPEVDGVLIIIHTLGGDVEAGLAIAEMIASLSKPTVSLVLGSSHSIGVPIAVSCTYSFIVPTATMVVHPVRTNGTVIGVPQTYEYFKLIQDRITGFICAHSTITEKKLEKMMTKCGIISKDFGTILVGEQAVEEGLIDEVGGIDRALSKLCEIIKKQKGNFSDKPAQK